MKKHRGTKKVARRQPRNEKLVAGKFRPGTAVAKMYEALEDGPCTWKELKKLAGGTDARARVYRIRAAGKNGGWKVKIAGNNVRLLPAKKAA